MDAASKTTDIILQAVDRLLQLDTAGRLMNIYIVQCIPMTSRVS